MIRNNSFKNANMRGVSFDHALVDGADFGGTDLSTCNLAGAVMKKLTAHHQPSSGLRHQAVHRRGGGCQRRHNHSTGVQHRGQQLFYNDT